MLTKNTPEFFEIVFGCSKIGAILVGLNWRLAPAEIEAIVADAAPAIIIVSADQQHLLASSSLPGLIVELGDGYERWRDSAPPTDPGVDGELHDVALILCTSGTTGMPKGVMLTNEGMSFASLLGTECGP